MTVELIDHAERYDSTAPRRFWLRRMRDETGVSRTGRVLEGVVWQDGRVTVQWRPPASSLGIYKDMAEFLAIHVECHPSASEVVWVDAVPAVAP
jgi:hypothetical protein